MARVLTCTDPVPNSDGSCTSAAYLEMPSLLPAMTVQEAQDIAATALLAFAAVMAVKLAFRKSQ
jgi:hypothetical protein